MFRQILSFLSGGSAEDFGQTEQARPNVTNPPQSGDLLDYTEPSDLLLLVDGTTVNFNSPEWNLEELQVSYDGKQLTFTEIASPTLAYARFKPNDPVELQMDFGNGLTTYFRGKIRIREHRGSNNQDQVRYVAHGYQNVANDIVIKDNSGVPLVYFPSQAITIIPTPGSSYVVYGVPIWAALNDLFWRCTVELSSLGIPATIGDPGTWAFSGNLPSDVSLQNCGFVEGLKQLCAFEPSRKPFFDDTSGTWIFPDILNADIEDVVVSSVNAGELSYTLDLTNRFTRLQLVTAWEGTQGMAKKAAAVCTEAWDPELQYTWCLEFGASVDDPTLVGSGYWAVYRRWAIPDTINNRHPTAPTRVYAVFDFWSNAKWVPIAAQVDFNNKVLMTNVPIVHPKSNPYDPGWAWGPDMVVVTYYTKDSMPTGGWYIYTEPSSGYTGNAYTLFGLEQTRTEIVDAVALNTGNAMAKLAIGKDVVVSGTLTLEGDPIPEFINLQRRLRVSDSSRTTGLEDIPAVIMGYTYRFGKRGANQITMGTDKTGFVRVI
jgi:hypothetical protein